MWRPIKQTSVMHASLQSYWAHVLSKYKYTQSLMTPNSACYVYISYFGQHLQKWHVHQWSEIGPHRDRCQISCIWILLVGEHWVAGSVGSLPGSGKGLAWCQPLATTVNRRHTKHINDHIPVHKDIFVSHQSKGYRSHFGRWVYIAAVAFFLFVIPPAKFAGVYTDPYVRPFVHISNPLLLLDSWTEFHETFRNCSLHNAILHLLF